MQLLHHSGSLILSPPCEGRACHFLQQSTAEEWINRMCPYSSRLQDGTIAMQWHLTYIQVFPTHRNETQRHTQLAVFCQVAMPHLQGAAVIDCSQVNHKPITLDMSRAHPNMRSAQRTSTPSMPLKMISKPNWVAAHKSAIATSLRQPYTISTL